MRHSGDAERNGRPSVLAILFGFPGSSAFRSLDERGEYLNIRSGATWDLFFAGYYRSDDRRLEHELQSQSVGHGFARDWYFNAMAFDMLRSHVERESQGLWSYSGGTDLVLINVWLPPSGDPTIDWDSVQFGCLSDREEGTSTLTLPQAIERISRDLQANTEDPNYGVAAVTSPESAREDGLGTKVMIGALGGIAAAFGKDLLGLK